MKFNHLNVPTQWENYWTRYPEGHTILEALIQWVSQVDDMVDNQNNLNENVEQFRNEIDEFVGRFDERLQVEVTNTLTDWQQSGFLDDIIDEALNTKYHEMNNRLTTQLANIANDLEARKTDKAKTSEIEIRLNNVIAGLDGTKEFYTPIGLEQYMTTQNEEWVI